MHLASFVMANSLLVTVLSGFDSNSNMEGSSPYWFSESFNTIGQDSRLKLVVVLTSATYEEEYNLKMQPLASNSEIVGALRYGILSLH